MNLIVGVSVKEALVTVGIKGRAWLIAAAGRGLFVVVIVMKVLGACLTLCVLWSPSRSFPLNSTDSVARQRGLCEFELRRCPNAFGSFCPRCDADGNFLPRQCRPSTGSCWCVDVHSGAEIPDTQTPPGVVPVQCGWRSYCPNGWTGYARRCFIFIDAPKTWTEAEIYCQFEGANLASIQSYEENHFLMSLTRGDTHDFPQTWIGGFDAVEPGYWMWSDGSKFYYENWYNTDKMYSRNETCLRMNYGYDFKWFNDYCTETHPFVCSMTI